MPDTSNLYRTSIKALILEKDKRFLLILEKNGLWEMPGGGIDFGEKPHDCIIREVREEMGLEVIHIEERPSYFLTALNLDGQWKSNVMYETTLKNMNFVPTDECVELRFFTKEEASKEKLFPIISEFIKIYNPDNH